MIFDAAKAQSEPLRSSSKQTVTRFQRQSRPTNPIRKSSSLPSAQGALIGQLAGIHAKSMAKFYQLLTPDQKTKFDTLHEKMMGFMGTRGGPRG